MNKQDLAQFGLLVLTPEEASFADELAKLQFTGKPGMDIAERGSVILKNTTKHSLVAFALRWKIEDPNGFLRTRDVMHLEPRVLLDGTRVRAERAFIPAGASRLITVEGLISTPEALKNFSSPFLQPGFTPMSVQLDIVVFDDGEAVGPDEVGLLPTLKATIDAKQDLMEEISNKLAKGEMLQNILDTLQKTASPLSKTHAPLDSVRTYASVRQQYLDELTTTERNFGDDVALQSLQHHKYTIRPNIHRRDLANDTQAVNKERN